MKVRHVVIVEIDRDGAEIASDERPLVAALAGEHLLRHTGANERIELYHDRIREALVQRIPPERARSIHRHLIRALQTNGVDDPETLYEHHLGAGEPERACSWAIRAGERAWNALAFERAAEFYGRALRLASTGQANLVDLRTRMGDALANAGRGLDAAETYLEAVKDTSGGAVPGDPGARGGGGVRSAGRGSESRPRSSTGGGHSDFG